MKCKCGIELNFTNGIDIFEENIVSRVVCPNCGISVLLYYKLDLSIFYNDEEIEGFNKI